MKNIIVKDGNKTYTQISKRTALKLFLKGETLCICPAKLNPGNEFWKPGMEFNNWEDLEDPAPDEDYETYFDTIVTQFIWGNCRCETGYYPRFYRITEN